MPKSEGSKVSGNRQPVVPQKGESNMPENAERGLSEVSPEPTPASFRSLEGRAVPVVTRDQMREIDRIAVEETGPNLLQMMENAGRSLAQLVLTHLGENANEARVLVMAGPGGNGGGGICAARHLALRTARVDLCLVEPDRLSTAAAHQLRVFRATGQRMLSLDDISAPGVGEEYDVVVDAVLGYSLRGSPRGKVKKAILWMQDAGVRLVSLDLASGVDADTGDTPGVFVTAEATLTLHLPKPGLENPATGALWLADLGIPASISRRAGVKDEGPRGDWLEPLEIGHR